MNLIIARIFAWSILVIAVVLLLLGLLFQVANDPNQLLVQSLFGIAILPYSAIGALLVSRRPRNAIGWILCAVTFVIISYFAEQYAVYALQTQPGSLPGGMIMAGIGQILEQPGWLLMFTYPFLLFPTGHLPSSRWRPVLYLAAAAIVANTLATSLTPGVLRDTSLPNPLGLENAGDLLSVLNGIAIILILITEIACIAAVITRYRYARGIERQQLKWFAFSTVIMVLAFAWAGGVVEALYPAVSSEPPLLALASNIILALAIGTLPAAIGIAILRYRLFDIDLLINRTLVYGLLTLMLALLYLACVVVFQQVFRPLLGLNSEPAIVLSTLAIASAFNPLRRRIQDFIDRRFYRRKYNAQQILATFHARLRTQVDLDDIQTNILYAAEETLQPSHISLWLKASNDSEKQ